MALAFLRRSKKPAKAKAHQNISTNTTQPTQTAKETEQSPTTIFAGQPVGENREETQPAATDDKVLPEETHLYTANKEEQEPILSDEDEKYLERVTSEDDSAPLPWGKIIMSDDGTEARLASEASQTPLPSSPDHQGSKGWNYFSWMPTQDTITSLTRLPSFRKAQPPAKRQKVNDGKVIQESNTVAEAPSSDSSEAAREQTDMARILSSLNLATLNNRVVSLSEDSQKLVSQFNLVLKDIIAGVPTAYDDLDKFISQRSTQIEKLYDTLPSFLQSAVRALPSKMWALLAPQVAAATATARGSKSTAADKNKNKSKKSSSYVPSLRDLVTKKGSVAAMMRSILGFLGARFPALLAGTNVLMSLTVFLLLFVFWYCHKRGKETRLAEEEMEKSRHEDFMKELEDDVTNMDDHEDLDDTTELKNSSIK